MHDFEKNFVILCTISKNLFIMPTFETQQTGCPNCGNSVTMVEAIKPQMECPFCHQHVTAPEVQQLQLTDGERMVRFATSKGDFTKQVVKKLTETAFVPTDIFNTIAPEKMHRAYVPMYVYEGTFTTNWTCKVQQEEVDVEGKKRLEYVPADGKTSGHFFFLLCAHDGKDIPAELVQFVESIPYKSSDFVPFNNEIITGAGNHDVYTWQQNADADGQFRKRGAAILKKQAEQAARTQLQDQKFRGLKTDYTHEFTLVGQRVMVPVWFIYYYYGNKPYYFLMDGKAIHLAQNMPEDKATSKKMKYRYMAELAMAGGSVILLPLLLHLIGKVFGASLLSSWITWLFIVGAWGYLAWRIYSVRKHKAQALQEAKTVRETAGARLLNAINSRTSSTEG